MKDIYKGKMKLNDKWYMSIDSLQYTSWKLKTIKDKETGSEKEVIEFNGYFGKRSQLIEAFLVKHVDDNMAKALQGNLDNIKAIATEVEHNIIKSVGDLK